MKSIECRDRLVLPVFFLERIQKVCSLADSASVSLFGLWVFLIYTLKKFAANNCQGDLILKFNTPGQCMRPDFDHTPYISAIFGQTTCIVLSRFLQCGICQNCDLLWSNLDIWITKQNLFLATVESCLLYLREARTRTTAMEKSLNG